MMLGTWKKSTLTVDDRKALYGQIAEQLARKAICVNISQIVRELYPEIPEGKAFVRENDAWLAYGDIRYVLHSQVTKKVHLIFEVKYGNVYFPDKQRARYIALVRAVSGPDTSVRVFIVRCRHLGTEVTNMEYKIEELNYDE